MDARPMILNKTLKHHINRGGVILLLCLSLSSCAALKAISAFMPSSSPSGISVDAQLGDKSVDVVGKSSARDIILDDGGTVKIDSRTINQGISPWWLALGLIFWQLPSITSTLKREYKHARTK